MRFEHTTESHRLNSAVLLDVMASLESESDGSPIDVSPTETKLKTKNYLSSIIVIQIQLSTGIKDPQTSSKVCF